MGFKLMTNFNKPYHSKSVSEFWKRWHISLSTWFRDYLYISLGGNRVTIPRWYLNLFIVFLVSGLWHGANWTFIVWGALHGFYLIFGIATEKIRRRINKKLLLDKIPALSTLVTFILVCFAWIFFRADNVKIAFYIASHIITGLPAIIRHPHNLIQYFGIEKKELILCFVVIFLLEAVHLIQRKIDIVQYFKARPIYFRWAIYLCILGIAFFFGIFEKRQFIYFQF
jgi:D-alanyl-lipoteichoic acid acyltransferase DltB (MBOAT superfamily)